MDFGTIKTNLAKGKYHTFGEWMSDMRLVFNNAYTYNAPGSVVHDMAKGVQERFEQKLARVVPRGNSQAGQPRIPPPPVKPSPTGGSNSKKRKMDTVARSPPPPAQPLKKQVVGKVGAKPPMTWEEKKNLGELMSKLNSTQLEKAVIIIASSKKVQEQSVEDSDTIDIDMNEVDEPTLRDLERFIHSCFSSEEDVVVDE